MLCEVEPVACAATGCAGALASGLSLGFFVGFARRAAEDLMDNTIKSVNRIHNG